ncbi:hypothetical protein GPECTOR_6g674 [Gonium pectorale]|uniref:Abnormal spindle-like microcephaly-associated protein ASH domain-containing protein n=1 Tax=Gonium pectorale TaxID=33097 RepID=A0A150GV49_GONPE|nr:hypothetical protein GPECTOR_6g674 [Gonium pectorale]|eukprot:KXZ53757.1 hypothetical protein GPECTOR_6g674 [Gonium pectorale]
MGRFGLDCPEQLEWRHWNPGTEYVKQLVLKNISTSVLKLRFKQPTSKAFSMDFPEPFKLRPGMSQSLKVIFRPLRMQHYTDNVELFVGNASFLVPVHAYTPVTHIEVPSQLDFGFTPCKETVTAPVVVKNSGDVRVDVTWRLEAPFAITPPSASLAPGESLSFVVAFTPPEACSYTANAACTLESGAAAICKISGIGKFPYLSVEQAGVDFGPVVVGQRVERTVRFGNHSVVAAHFTVNHDPDGPDDGVFVVGPAKGTLGPEEYSVLRLSYTPRSTGTFSSETFLVGTAGGNTVALNLRGAAVAPTVTLSARAFNFGNVPTGTPASRVLYIRNHSAVPVPYDFQTEPLDVFSISRVRGVLAPETTAHVTITFKAAVPANYWRRVALLLKDADPQGVDLVATSFSDKSRPPPLAHRHVGRYLARVAAGASPVEEAQLDSAPPSAAAGLFAGPGEFAPQPNGTATAAADAASATAMATAIVHDTEASEEGGSDARLLGPDSWTLVFGGQDPAHALEVDPEVLDFGTTSRLRGGEYRTVTLTNTTAAKLTAFFVVPEWQDPGAPPGEPPKPVFQVFPESVDVRPRGQAIFKVAFRPPRDGAFFSQQLTLVAHVKSQRNFRLVADHQMLPSWSLPVQASGNTFLHSNPEFSPKVELSTRSISFPPCRPGDAVHQTILVANNGDTPTAFNFGAPSALWPLFHVRPAAGVVPPKGHVLIGLRFTPTDTRPAATNAIVTFNGVASNAVTVLLRGCAHTPRLTTDLPSSTLYFRPTCVGASSQRAITLHNPSRVPLAFRWRLPPRVQGVISVTPASGTLRGNESVQLLWHFVPAAQKLYEGRAACLVLSPLDAAAGGEVPADGGEAAVGGEEGEAVEGDGVFVSLVGEGTQGAVALEPPSLALGDLRVGHPVRRALLLHNVSDGVLRYKLEVAPAEDDELPAAEATACDFTAGLDSASSNPAASAGLECWVDEPEGALPARASKTVTVTLFPRYRKRYSLQVRCRSSTVAPLGAGANRPPSAGRLAPAASDAAGPEGPPPVIAPLTAAAAFPSIEVTDVYCEGLPKQLLWQLLGVNQLNHHLRTEVSDTELRLRAAHDRGSLTTEAACAAMAAFPMEFGTHGLGGRPRVVHVELSNPTPLPVSWQLHSFDDPDGVELENWVEPGGRPRSEGERMRHLIAEYRLFEMRPRSGSLEPGARGTVTFEFRPSVVGCFQLPIFLHVTDGKRLRLQLQAVTTPDPLQLLCLPPPLRTFRLQPVALGEPSPPLQMYSLRPGGPAAVRFRLDTGPLAALAAESWGHRVLELVGPAVGEIPEGGVAAINWRFSPLEAKEYRVEVPVLLGDGKVEVIELVGRGYAPPPSRPHGAVPAVPLAETAAGQAGDAGLAADEAAAAAADAAAADRGWATWRGLSASPSAGMAGRLAMVDHDLVSLGVTPVRGLTRRIVVLTNKSRYPLAFDWDLAALAPPPGVPGPPLPSADLLADRPLQGALAITPASGSLEPGERLVCRVALHAGVTPQIWEGEIRCTVRVDEEVLEAAAAEAAAGAAALAAAEAATMEQVEEVIAESPARGPPPPPPAVAAAQRASKLRSRLPVHAYMTTAIRNRIEPLAQQFAATLEARTMRAVEGARPASFPEPQTLCVTLCGRILEPEQLAALRYVPPHEVELARAAVAEGAAWVPAESVPFWEAEAPQPAARADAAAPWLGREGPDDADGDPGQARELAGGSARPDLSLSLKRAGVDTASRPTTPVMTSAGANGNGAAAVPPPPAGLGSGGNVVEVTFAVPPSSLGDSRAPSIGGDDLVASATVAGDGLHAEGSGGGGDADGAEAAGEGEEARVRDGAADGTVAAGGELVPPPLPPPPPAGGGDEYDSLISARDVLSGLFSELMDDPELRRAFEYLPPEEVQPFALVRSAPPPCYDAGVRPEISQVAAEASAASAAAAAAAASPPQAPAGAEGGDVDLESDPELRRVLVSAEWRNLADFVLESALLGLMQESAAGDWGMTGQGAGE